MRLIAVCLLALAGCANLPPDGTPYFQSSTSGDNLYPAVQTRVYATDQLVRTESPHPSNNNQGRQEIRMIPGAFADGRDALGNLPPSSAATAPLFDPDACCHVFVQRDYIYYDGQTNRAISEAVWRRAAAIPPFVDQQ